MTATPERLARLTPEERTQYARFLVDRKRHEFLCTRLLVQHVLGDAKLATNEWGRPFLADDPSHFFNITHTDGLILLFESDAHELGVDTELISRAPTLLRLAPNVFSETEQAELHALPEADRAFRAVTLWTLKESYIKARGMGLALSLRGFSFRFDQPHPRVEIEPRLNDVGARWQFRTFTHGPHLISTAIDRPASSPVAVDLREVTLP